MYFESVKDGEPLPPPPVPITWLPFHDRMKRDQERRAQVKYENELIQQLHLPYPNNSRARSAYYISARQKRVHGVKGSQDTEAGLTIAMHQGAPAKENPHSFDTHSLTTNPGYARNAYGGVYVA